MYQRKQYLDELIKFKDTDFIKVITGVRRAGKSVLLMQYKELLLNEGISENNILYINFESYEFSQVVTERKFRELIDEFLDNKKDKVYLLFDEIQNVVEWQKVINGIRVSFNSDIVITGSNASMLSGELATLLSGRYIEIPIYPFSFREYLNALDIDFSSREVDKAYFEYEKFGGFPSVIFSSDDLKDTILSGIFDSIVLNDVALRAEIKDTMVLKALIAFLADNVGQLVNVSRIVNTLKNEGIQTSSHTISRYLEILEDAYLFSSVKQYDIRGREYLRTNSKYFIADSGLRRNAIGRKDGNYSNRLENIVFIELLRRGYSVDVGRINKTEIDFIARKLDETVYIQVAYDLPNNTHETDNLLNIHDNYKKILILGRYADVDMIDGIEVKYIVDWLINVD